MEGDPGIIAYMGTRGSGKTYRFCADLAHLPRVIMFDGVADKKLAGDDPVFYPKGYGVKVEKVSDVIVLATRTPDFHIRVQWDDIEKFDYICGAALKLKNCYIAVDELSLFCNSNFMPPNFKRLVRLGRHSNCGLRFTTQRPPDIQALILSQCKEIYLFQMHLPNDLRYLGQFVPDIERVRTLKKGECIVWNPEKPQTPPTPPAPSPTPSQDLPPTPASESSETSTPNLTDTPPPSSET